MRREPVARVADVKPRPDVITAMVLAVAERTRRFPTAQEVLTWAGWTAVDGEPQPGDLVVYGKHRPTPGLTYYIVRPDGSLETYTE